MLFRSEHIEMIEDGTKTATRRDWKRKMAKKSGVYPCQEEMFQPREECGVFIKVTNLYKQRLGDMTKENAREEGDYSLKEFKELWEEINDSWDPNLEVSVVEFESLWVCSECGFESDLMLREYCGNCGAKR